MKLDEKLCSILVLTCLLILIMVPFPIAYSDEYSAPDLTLDFVSSAVGIDLTKYTVTLKEHKIDNATLLRETTPWANPALFAIYPLEKVYFLLESENSTVDLYSEIKDGYLYSLLVSPRSGSVYYSQSQPTNLLDFAKNILDVYQTLVDTPFLEKMDAMLDDVVEVKPLTKTVDNMTLEISESSFCWMYNVHGIDVRKKSVRINFDKGVFYSFYDDWTFYDIGTAEINISKEEALQMVIEKADTFSWKVRGDNETWIEVTEFTLQEEPWRITLSYAARDTLTLYPYWKIWILFTETIYTNDGINAGIWADTGEFENFDVTGFGGVESGEILPDAYESSDTIDQTNTQESSFDQTSFIMTVSVALVCILVALLFYKRKKIHNP